MASNNPYFPFHFLCSILFEFGLAAYAGGGHSNFIFNAAVDLTIFGKRLYLAIGFNLKDPVGSLRGGADKATDWYKDKMNPKNPTDTEKNYYDNPNPFADFEMSGNKGKKIINNPTLIKNNRFFISFLSFFVLEESPWNFEKAFSG